MNSYYYSKLNEQLLNTVYICNLGLMSLKVRSTYRSEVVQVEGSLYVPSRFLLSFLKCLMLRAEKKDGASALYRPHFLL